ncbi:MAG: hypothetical protein UW27_C0001G0075 [Parcubacteria group bacterium GW2011_GWA1_44_13]|uniref:Uncharacterized protein n=1 Tax=Candidatus Nomurabacteria bacterium GW2011_GWB1_44_12 TaxID=1618748 RepID=A0A837I8H7_9BACT|nr:MAG: hypothetical protein UW17_C0020G0009 [Candidatus Nomurabacteria bacterium GW2011_GWD1_44_10]KKT37268.1 MAG: hypothetical protein UW25_C0001G0076 [Candidatus Nomurabacteria bacterium GW2011_GWB1_44_12]KKT38579.1 MAG: hypothetical protein UW27_C0001G0075 [Parcubacteria group bacterium GW2011_GWA1_44_13]KKT59211.1 MAG: hypothetical protein UW54_C0032G0004 [Parcubacteria group bacterium GW2011_GWC1_44_26]HBB44001.1 hypothetical protein [Candidatus Yonathbacteria bacterium]
MGIIDRIENLIKPEDKRFEVKMRAQYDIIQMSGGDDIAGTWIDANGKRFDELLEDSQYNFYNLLLDEKTYNDTLQKIKDKLYH